MSAWTPDWVMAPGEILYDYLDENGGSVADLAVATGLSPEVLAGILDGSEPITDEIAEVLHQATNVSAIFWLNLERAYREGLAEGKPLL